MGRGGHRNAKNHVAASPAHAEARRPFCDNRREGASHSTIYPFRDYVGYLIPDIPTSQRAGERDVKDRMSSTPPPPFSAKPDAQNLSCKGVLGFRVSGFRVSRFRV